MANVFKIGCLGKTLLQYSVITSLVESSALAATYDVISRDWYQSHAT